MQLYERVARLEAAVARGEVEARRDLEVIQTQVARAQDKIRRNLSASALSREAEVFEAAA